MSYRSVLALLLSVLLAACGGGGGSSGSATDTSGSTTTPPITATGPAPAAPASCSLPDQKAWVTAVMADDYFWYDHLGTPNAAASTIDAYFSSLLYPTVDRFSYTQPTAQFSQFFSDGTRVGYGYSLVFTDNTQAVLRIRAIEPGSPVDLAGLRRGDTVLSIDGYTPLQIAAGAAGAVSTAGVSRTFVLRNTAGVLRTVTVLSATFNLVPVQADQVIDLQAPVGTRKVAYMAYMEFITGGNAAMGSAFSRFVASGASEMVLDLRYNGGGQVDIAQILSSLIGGSRLAGQTFTQLRFNARHPELNETIPFTANSSALPGPALQGLQRVFIIASPSTASASELVINALKPFMDVVLIGGTTYGKPYGFDPTEACGTVFNAVNFESVNALGVGGYTSGFSPTCAVADDLDHALGDPAEGELAAALYYARNGACPPTPSAAAQGMAAAPAMSAPVITEGAPPGMWRR